MKMLLRFLLRLNDSLSVDFLDVFSLSGGVWQQHMCCGFGTKTKKSHGIVGASSTFVSSPFFFPRVCLSCCLSSQHENIRHPVQQAGIYSGPVPVHVEDTRKVTETDGKN